MAKEKIITKFDKQITGMAGEFLAMGKLCKMELQVSLTLRNTKAIDIFAHNPRKNKRYNVQVKTSRKEKTNFRYLKGEEIQKDDIFIFIVLNDKVEDQEDFFIVKGSESLNNVHDFFGSTYTNENLPEKGTVNYRALEGYKDNWKVFNT